MVFVFLIYIKQSQYEQIQKKKKKNNQINDVLIYTPSKKKKKEEKTQIETSIRIKKTNSTILSSVFSNVYYITRSTFEKTKMNFIYSSPSDSLSSSSSPSSSSCRCSPLLLLLLLFVEFVLAVVKV